MENASKALIIAGAVLLAILVLTIGVFLVNNFGRTAESYTRKLDTAELEKYNANFEVYRNRTNISAQEIITVINIALQTENGTAVHIDNLYPNKNLTTWSNSDKTQFLEKYILKYNQDGTIENNFTCTLISTNEDGKIIDIRFKLNY